MILTKLSDSSKIRHCGLHFNKTLLHIEWPLNILFIIIATKLPTSLYKITYLISLQADQHKYVKLSLFLK
jgi:hypothetical protein